MLHLYWEHVWYSEIIFRYGNPSTQKVEQKDYSPLFTYGKLYGSSFWLMFAMFLKWFNKLRALLLPYNKYISAMDIDGL